MSHYYSFIESQFPVSKISKESYKERKAGASQTLTGLGKWWGRKPLILVRATILGLLIPASDDPKKDLDIFLKIMTMDEEGLRKRKNKTLSYNEIFENGNENLFKNEFGRSFQSKEDLKRSIDRSMRAKLESAVFGHLNYDDKLRFCDRPENIEGPTEEAWVEINDHLGTNATNLQELVQQLGDQQFGHTPRVGDAFCGGGSIPFEAARIGCKAYGSDLNPAAALLTWASLNIVGGGDEVQSEVKDAQKDLIKKVDKQIQNWGIEHNEKGWRADAYLYCVETKSPATGYMVPMAPSWVISEKHKVCAVLHPDHSKKNYRIEIINGADKETMNLARKGTIDSGDLICPETGNRYSISSIRGDNTIDGEKIYGLRMWEKHDYMPRPNDTFQERLYCIRYEETRLEVKKAFSQTDKQGVTRSYQPNDIIAPKELLLPNDEEVLVEQGILKRTTTRHYVQPDPADLEREQRVTKLLSERFLEWQYQGIIPSMEIVRGYNTEQPIRERGWTYWHHLFNPRQLLTLGLMKQLLLLDSSPQVVRTNLLYLTKITENYAKIMTWHTSRDGFSRVFSNQALNTYFTYACRSLKSIQTIPFISNHKKIHGKHSVKPNDARTVDVHNDFWITDPPYADAVNYHELGDFFLAWYEKDIPKLFPEWYSDSKAALAVKGSGESFKQSMVQCYRNFTDHMPDNGAQVVMFTHQDSAVWADLALILWASGLQVTAAWTIQTETDSAGIKKGNYVQGTVIMVLRKRQSKESGFLMDIQSDVEIEVIKQLDHMTTLDDQEDPNFGDADYQLAAYAAALRVLTGYDKLEDIDVEYELRKERRSGDHSEIEKIIESAVSVAMDHLIPTGFHSADWRILSPEERFYIKGLEIQGHGEYRSGVYQELARGYGLRSYTEFLKSGRANETRLMTPIEFARKELSKDGFGNSTVRHLLFAIRETHQNDNPVSGRNWLKNELPDYWGDRKLLMNLLDYILLKSREISHWSDDAKAARLLRGYLENDSL